MGQTLAPIMARWEVWLILLASWGRSSGSFSEDDVILLDSGDELLDDDDDDDDGPLLSTPISISVLFWTSSLSPISLFLSLSLSKTLLSFHSIFLSSTVEEQWKVEDCLFVVVVVKCFVGFWPFWKGFTFNIQRTWEFCVLFLLFFWAVVCFLRIKCKIYLKFQPNLF